ncbi:hypothetical protein AOLI_G00025240 [Acnodon oligacanthus]
MTEVAGGWDLNPNTDVEVCRPEEEDFRILVHLHLASCPPPPTITLVPHQFSRALEFVSAASHIGLKGPAQASKAKAPWKELSRLVCKGALG